MELLDNNDSLCGGFGRREQPFCTGLNTTHKEDFSVGKLLKAIMGQSQKDTSCLHIMQEPPPQVTLRTQQIAWTNSPVSHIAVGKDGTGVRQLIKSLRIIH
jgi:hypothetical protein